MPVNVIMTLDLSASVVGSRLLALQRAGIALVDAMAPEDSAALLGFNRAVVQRVPLTRDLNVVRRALPRTSAEGDTALNDAALAAMLLGDSEGGRTLVVLFSDGVDTASFTRPDVVDRNGAPRERRCLRRQHAGRRHPVPAHADRSHRRPGPGSRCLGRPGPAFLEILQEFRRRYVITFMPTGVERGGWHQLSVRVVRRNARVQARPGYFSTQR